MKEKTPFKQYWDDLTPTEKEKLAKDCKTSVGYLKQISNGHRNFGLGLAKRIEKRTNIPRTQLRRDLAEWMDGA